MAVLLFFIGAVTLIAGIAAAVFGIPSSEFSFGNTLISAGVTAAIGGLIVMALSAVVFQLQQIVAAMATQEPDRANQLNSALADRARFPSKPEPFKREAYNPEPAKTVRSMSVAAGSSAMEAQISEPFKPTLPNPDGSPRIPVESANFKKGEPAEPISEERSPTSQRNTENNLREETTSAGFKADSQSRNIAVLKSGVIDGMAYTLYVDGSIEADLPQGTLRFASIIELRRHLEKSS